MRRRTGGPDFRNRPQTVYRGGKRQAPDVVVEGGNREVFKTRFHIPLLDTTVCGVLGVARTGEQLGAAGRQDGLKKRMGFGA